MKTGLSPQYIMKKSLCRKAHCASEPDRMRYAQAEIDNLQISHKYAEPGYDDPEEAILFANWNYFPPILTSLLEKAGYEIEWSDEWTFCEECGGALRTSPDCWFWEPFYRITKDGVFCKECAAKEEEDNTNND